MSICSTLKDDFCIDCPSISLRGKDKSDLIRLLRVPERTDINLVKHYAAMEKDMYLEFLISLCKQTTLYKNLETSKLVEEPLLDSSGLVSSLTGKIVDYDDVLEIHLAKEKVKKRIGKFDHQRICELFAKNVIAKNSVRPSDKLL